MGVQIRIRSFILTKNITSKDLPGIIILLFGILLLASKPLGDSSEDNGPPDDEVGFKVPADSDDKEDFSNEQLSRPVLPLPNRQRDMGLPPKLLVELRSYYKLLISMTRI